MIEEGSTLPWLLVRKYSPHCKLNEKYDTKPYVFRGRYWHFGSMRPGMITICSWDVDRAVVLNITCSSVSQLLPHVLAITSIGRRPPTRHAAQQVARRSDRLSCSQHAFSDILQHQAMFRQRASDHLLRLLSARRVLQPADRKRT